MANLNLQNFDTEKTKELVKQLEEKTPGMAKLFEQLTVYEEQIKQWFAEKENSRQLFQSDPKGCLKEILGDNYAEIEESLNNLKQQVNTVPLAVELADKAPYVPAAVNYTNGWDAISANTVPTINQVFQVAYKHFCTEKNGDKKSLAFSKDIWSEEAQSTVHLDVVMDIPTLSITGVNGTMMAFTTGKTNIDVSIRGEGMSDIKATITNCFMIIKINVSNAVITTQTGEQVFNVFIGVADDSCQDNDLLAPKVEFYGDKPPMIGKLIWKTILGVIGEGVQNLIVNMEEGKQYQICSVTLNAKAIEMMERYDWLIPNTARFNTQNDAMGEKLENYALVIFMMTAHPFYSGLNLDVPVDTLNAESTGTVALSGPILLKNVLLKILNKGFQSKYSISDTFAYVEEDGTTQAYLKITDGKSVDIPFHVNDLPVFGAEDLTIHLNDAKIRLVDGGIHLELNIKSTVKDFIDFSGPIKLQLAINGIERDGDFSVNLVCTNMEQDIDIKNGWAMILTVVLTSIIGTSIFGIFSLIAGIVIPILIEELDNIIDFDGLIKEVSLNANQLVSWKGIDFAKIKSLNISYGAKIGYQLNLHE